MIDVQFLNLLGVELDLRELCEYTFDGYIEVGGRVG
jgi:hypothetical protein